MYQSLQGNKAYLAESAILQLNAPKEGESITAAEYIERANLMLIKWAHVVSSAPFVRPDAMNRTIPREIEARVLRRDGYTCQMCGLGASDPDPFVPTRKVQLVMGHIIDKSLGGEDIPDKLRAVCTNCNEGLQNTAPPKPHRLQLMMQLRRATVSDQRYALEWLEKKFSIERSTR